MAGRVVLHRVAPAGMDLRRRACHNTSKNMIQLERLPSMCVYKGEDGVVD
jgi:hypothetical protein